ncbi:MAG: hypothetical protein HZA81_03705 [Candidatus Taylorbacteria bacterium]|nr:hypothetical protein [Candidatus Taylorbacteria bacterium]
MHPQDIDTEKTGSSKLEGKARAVVDSYLALPLGTKPSCPYFNNRRRKGRGGLRVLVGKGAPEEIAGEAEIFALRQRIKLNLLSTDKLKEFLCENDLGVDCSGFAYHALDALCREKRGRGIQSFVKSNRTGILGKILARLRPAENLGVSSFRNDKNGSAVKVRDAMPGDLITFMGTGRDKTYNHILVITGVDRLGGDTRLTYAHSYSWPSDGLYGHGVREGDILVHGEDLLGGTWKEQGQTGSDNYTFTSARDAKEVSLRRLNFLVER